MAILTTKTETGRVAQILLRTAPKRAAQIGRCLMTFEINLFLVKQK